MFVVVCCSYGKLRISIVPLVAYSVVKVWILALVNDKSTLSFVEISFRFKKSTCTPQFKINESLNKSLKQQENILFIYNFLIQKFFHKSPMTFFIVGLVSLFNGISTFVGQLMPKPFS